MQVGIGMHSSIATRARLCSSYNMRLSRRQNTTISPSKRLFPLYTKSAARLQLQAWPWPAYWRLQTAANRQQPQPFYLAAVTRSIRQCPKDRVATGQGSSRAVWDDKSRPIYCVPTGLMSLYCVGPIQLKSKRQCKFRK